MAARAKEEEEEEEEEKEARADEDGGEDNGNLMSLSDVKSSLTHKYGPNAWEEKIYPRIK